MVEKLVFWDMQENTYFIWKDHDCVIIDPGCRFDEIVHFLEKHSLNLKAILLTHGHFDHIVAVDELSEKYDCPVYAHQLTASFVKDDNLTLGKVVNAPISDIGNGITINDMHFDFIYTPGHTHDGGLYYYKEENALFTGDTLFKNSIGRYDLPTANVEELIQSLRKIAFLNFDAVVYPGHGPQSTLAIEQMYNPYLRQIRERR